MQNKIVFFFNNLLFFAGPFAVFDHCFLSYVISQQEIFRHKLSFNIYLLSLFDNKGRYIFRSAKCFVHIFFHIGLL